MSNQELIKKLFEIKNNLDGKGADIQDSINTAIDLLERDYDNEYITKEQAIAAIEGALNIKEASAKIRNLSSIYVFREVVERGEE